MAEETTTKPKAADWWEDVYEVANLYDWLFTKGTAPDAGPDTSYFFRHPWKWQTEHRAMLEDKEPTRCVLSSC